MTSRSIATVLFVSVALLCWAVEEKELKKSKEPKASTTTGAVTRTTYFAEQMKRVEKNTSVGDANSRTFLREVVTGERDTKIRGDICAYPTAARKAAISGPYAFHTTVGCKAVAWLANRLCAFVESTPAFYGAADDVCSDDEEDDYEPRCTVPPAFDSAERETVDRLVVALNRLADVDAVGSFRTGAATLLKTVLTLAGRARLVTAASDSRAIVRLMLDDMIGVQRFAVVNCAETTEVDSRLFGIWASADHKGALDEMMVALTAVESTYTDRTTTCSVDRILSTSLAHVFISEELDDAFVVITSTGNVTVKELREKVQDTRDADATYWCYDAVVMATVKLVVNKARRCAGERHWTNNIMERVNQINSQLQLTDDKTDWPEYFVEAFDILSKADYLNVRPRLNEYYHSLVGIELAHVDVQDNIFSCVESDFSIVLSYLDIIFNNLDDLYCFNRMFKSVRLERQKYYIPYIKNNRILLPTGEDGDTSDEICDFVKNIYDLCFQAYYLFNKHVDNKLDRPGSIYINDLWNTVRDVKNYFLIVIKKKTNNAVINKIAYDMATILVNLRQESTDRYSLEFEIKRVLNVIMNEMNGYEVKYCGLNTPIFLLFNKINLYNFGNKNILKKSIEKFLKSNLNNFSADDLNFGDSITKKDYQFLSVQYFFDRFIKNSNYYDTYKTKIQFNWKGSVQTLGDIFENESLLILNALNFYELYHVYFIYCAAAIFYPVRWVLSIKKKLKHVSTNFQQIKLQLPEEGFWTINFPPEMKSFLLEIDHLLNLPTSLSQPHIKIKDSQAMSKLREAQNSIDKQFIKLNVVFQSTSPIKKYSIKYFCSSSTTDINEYTTVYSELLGTLKEVFHNFLEIYHTSKSTDHFDKSQLDTDTEDEKFIDIDIETEQ